MTFTELYQAYLELIWGLFQYDIEVFSQSWIYIWALIPAIAYSIFFTIKWALLTFPIWFPLGVILNSIRWRR